MNYLQLICLLGPMAIAGIVGTPPTISEDQPKALFFGLGNVYYSDKVGALAITIPWTDVIAQSKHVLKVVPAHMERLSSALQNLLQPKLVHLNETVSGLVAFEREVPNQTRTNHTRVTREIGFNVNIDPAAIFNVIFSGISDIIGSTSVKEVKEQLGELAHHVEDLSLLTHVLGDHQLEILKLLGDQDDKIGNVAEQFFLYASLASLVDGSVQSVDLIHSAAVDIAKGEIPGILTALEIQSALQALEEGASHQSLTLLLDTSRPLDVFRLPSSVITEPNGDWTVLVQVPLTRPRLVFQGFEYVDIPFLSVDGQPMQLEQSGGLFAITNTLPSDQEHLFIPTEKIQDHCMEILDKTVCADVTVFRANDVNCIASLYTGENPEDVTDCQISDFKGVFPPQAIGNTLIVFSSTTTTYSISCPATRPYLLERRGRATLNLQPGCEVKTDKLVFIMPDVAVNATTLVSRSMFKLPESDPIDQDVVESNREQLNNTLADLEKGQAELEILIEEIQASRTRWSVQNQEIMTITSLSLSSISILLLGAACLYLAHRARIIRRAAIVPNANEAQL